MKIAIIVYGQTRLFDITIKSWNFRNQYDCDFYFSTWDKTEMRSDKLGIKYEEHINEDVIKKYIPNAKIHILKESDFFDSTYLTNEEYNNTIKSVFHMKNALRMVRENGNHYDMMMIMRSDQYLTFKTSSDILKNLCEENKIYGLGKLYTNGLSNVYVNDTFFCGGFNEISHLIRTLPNTMNNIHKELGEHILKTNLNLVDCSRLIKNMTVRPNCRDLNENEINEKSIEQKKIEWGSQSIKNN